ncbi:YncE family protein [Microcella sp.]|uniref:YncE family protein n=1 Tax=Microcella sp. TaxID=1913979 RepID=UPI00299F6287|nr:YncE family protein [Microcella sp.]MDX2025182.1 YncE family protein [Microcella sp.]
MPFLPLARRSALVASAIALATTVVVAAPAIAAAPGTETITFTIDDIDYWAATPDGSKIVMSSYDESKILIIDTATNSISTAADPTSLLEGPGQIAITPDGLTAYVANYSRFTVAIVDITTGAITGEITDPAFSGPWALALNRAGDQLLMHDYNTEILYVIDIGTNAVIDSLDLSGAGTSATEDAWSVVVSPDGSKAFVVYDDGSIIVVDLTTLTVDDEFVPPALGYLPGSCVSPDGSTIYQADWESLSFRSVSLETGDVLATNPSTPRSPADPTSGTFCTVSPNGQSVFLTDQDASSPGVVTEYDAQTLALIATHSFDDVDLTQHVMVYSACEAYVTGRDGNAQTFDLDCAAAPELAATGTNSAVTGFAALLAALLLSLGGIALAVRRRYSAVRSNQ